MSLAVDWRLPRWSWSTYSSLPIKFGLIFCLVMLFTITTLSFLFLSGIFVQIFAIPVGREWHLPQTNVSWSWHAALRHVTDIFDHALPYQTLAIPPLTPNMATLPAQTLAQRTLLLPPLNYVFESCVSVEPLFGITAHKSSRDILRRQPKVSKQFYIGDASFRFVDLQIKRHPQVHFLSFIFIVILKHTQLESRLPLLYDHGRRHACFRKCSKIVGRGARTSK